MKLHNNNSRAFFGALLLSMHLVSISSPQTPSANTYYNQAEHLRNAGKTTDAIELYKKAIATNRDHFEAHFYLANELFKIGDYDTAAHHYQEAARVRPTCVPALYNLGFTLQLQNHKETAIPYLEQAVAYQPSHTRARILLGTLYQQHQRDADAFKQFEAALALDATNSDALMACARYEKHQEHFKQAIDYYKKAYQHNPQQLSVAFELGYCYQQLGELHEAVTFYNHALTIDAECMDALANKAHALRHLGTMHEAQLCYEQLLLKRPTDAHLHYGYAESLLATGNFEKGFEEFEWRWKRDGDSRNFGYKLWDGSPIDGKTILLRAEYGQGDTLQFIRYAKLLKKSGARVILEAQHSLVTLLSHCPYLDLVVPVDAPLPAFDVQLPLMSLPRMFKSTKETTPQTVPYLEINPELIAHWASFINKTSGFKIGICWDSSPYYNSFNSHLSKKSIPLAMFEPLAHIPGVQLYSLQRMNGTEQLASLPDGMMIHTFGEDFDLEHGRFMDTAAVMHHLDLVITVDTSVAHLAGSLAVPVWVLLPQVADWRWMQDTDESPWYPTMRLFRQQIPGDWEFLMDSVTHEVERYVKKAPCASDIVTAEISVGELIDKITILEIKQEEFTNAAKLKNVITELCTLNKTRAAYVPRSPEILELTKQLKEVNRDLWHIEDAIRDKEYDQEFDAEFIQLARSVYVTNDLRCKIKRTINDVLGSRLVEEKSYKDYLNKTATTAQS